jgi:hypothetical protein
LWIAAVGASLIATGSIVSLALFEMPPQPSLIMIGSALLLSLGVDAKLGALAPRWWMGLRVPLSLALGVTTLTAAVV